MSKHTPAPWDYATNVGTMEKEQGFHMRFLIGANGQGFAHTVGLSLAEEDEANARLIAAAPDLLEACKEAEALVIGWAGTYAIDYELPTKNKSGIHSPDEWHPTHKEIFDKVRAAIAKAESTGPTSIRPGEKP